MPETDPAEGGDPTDDPPTTPTTPAAGRPEGGRMASFRHGVRLGLPYAVAGTMVSTSFGVLGVETGLTPWQAIITSAVVFAGSAQFTAFSIVAGGGGLAAALAAATLMNSRFLAMGIALAPSLPGGPLRRAVQGQPVVDASWVLANRGDGTFDRWQLFGTTAPQWVTWVGGTALGAVAGDAIGDLGRFGFDAVFPAFFVALLVSELRRRTSRPLALAGAAIALVAVPFTPAGVPILLASFAALLALRRPR